MLSVEITVTVLVQIKYPAYPTSSTLYLNYVTICYGEISYRSDTFERLFINIWEDVSFGVWKYLKGHGTVVVL